MGFYCKLIGPHPNILGNFYSGRKRILFIYSSLFLRLYLLTLFPFLLLLLPFCSSPFRDSPGDPISTLTDLLFFLLLNASEVRYTTFVRLLSR